MAPAEGDMPPIHFFNSIRFRLTLLYSVIMSAVLIGFSLSLIFVFSDSLLQAAEDQLKTYASKVSSDLILNLNYDSGVKQAPVTGGYARTPDGQQYLLDLTIKQQGAKLAQGEYAIQISSGSGAAQVQELKGDATTLRSPAAQRLKTAAQQKGSATGEIGTKKVLAMRVTRGRATAVIEVAEDISHIHDTLNQVFFYLEVAIPLILCMATALGWFLAGRALAPVGKIRRLASEISVSDLSKRLHIAGDDELAQLAGTFDGMIERLEGAFQRQKQFTSDASHELRTPLAVMQADFSLALRRRRGVGDYEGILRSAQEEIVRMSAIVDDLSMLARMDNSKMVLNLGPVQLDDLLRDLVARMEVLASEKGITMVTRELAPVSILADDRLLKQLILNLLNNAVAYTPERGHIEVRLIPLSKSEVAFHVRDTGIGIPEAAQPHVFDRFYRVDASRQRNPGGSGLGLAICQSIVTAHGGNIGAHSVEGMGSTFTVVLPVGGPTGAPLVSAREGETPVFLPTPELGSRPAFPASAH